MPLDPEVGFTSDVIRDPKRFVGRQDLVQECIKGINAPLGLIAIYGRRGVGKSSLLRQVQQMANGDYTLAHNAGLRRVVLDKPRRYYTVYYQCDAMIKDAGQLLTRLCNDQNEEDGLLRLVPDEGKELTEFTRSSDGSLGVDLKVVQWGRKGTDSSKYSRAVPGDVVQTFRNFVDSVLDYNNRFYSKRDGVLILLDEFDVIEDKSAIGSIIKSMSSARVKFGICGIARDLTELVVDHGSVERLLEEGAIHVRPMNDRETSEIFATAERLFKSKLTFAPAVVSQTSDLSGGYPYLAQLMGKACVGHANDLAVSHVGEALFDKVLDEIRTGRAFPTLEAAYQRAIGNSEPRQLLLTLLAEQRDDLSKFNDEIQRVML